MPPFHIVFPLTRSISCLKNITALNWKLFVMKSGRSMGSRAAAALARQLSDESEEAVQGVICLSFPLHPPGKTHAYHQRSEDLKKLPESVHVLFVSGTEDNMCNRVSVKMFQIERKNYILTWGNVSIFNFWYPSIKFFHILICLGS